MYLTVDFEDKRPLYQQVVDGIKELIARGTLREGATLPSVRQVAGDLGVNLNTIATAYRQLQEEGLVAVRHGFGAVVKARRSDFAGQDELRKGLRAALTQLVLAGLAEKEIVTMVREELAVVGGKAK
ncbi:MAG: GntR family transcriptional regulator [Bryobacteraceae bacterium]|nr:GntR family transcriptional regulator [Bryobacteraceae bacterium]